MKFLVKVSIPNDKCNEMMRDGSFGPKMDSMLADMKPEAVYFFEECGKRTGLFIVDMKETSEMAKIAEPFFLAFNANVYFHPVMKKEDLAKAGPYIAHAAEKY